MSAQLVVPTNQGLYCAAGDFYIDPPRPVANAVLTHAHADHARAASDTCWASPSCVPLLQHRLGRRPDYKSMQWGERYRFGTVTVSLHPAGHILGSAQVRIEHAGEVWLVTGDYKREPDPSCEPFELVPCDVLITETTFALPVYRWPAMASVVADILDWHDANLRDGRSSILFCYALGKAQRLLAELVGRLGRPVLLHGAMVPLTRLYEQAGVRMASWQPASEADKESCRQSLVLAPPSAAGSAWMKRFPRAATGFASGWMRVRGQRRRRPYDRGFVISDHVDWPGLLDTVAQTGAGRVLATHGRSEEFVRYLCGQGIHAEPLQPRPRVAS